MSKPKDETLFDVSLNTTEKRLKTFKKWPFAKSSTCNKEKMAEAGFHFVGSKREPDLVCCYVCFKELDGWEEGDDPWEEHKNHASYCPFIKLAKKEDELSVQDSLELEMHRNKNLLLNKLVNKKVAEFESRAKETRELLLAMATS